MSHTAEEFVQLCLKQAGKPYVWGAVGPDAYDCSGLVMDAVHDLGLSSFPHYSGSQYNACQHITVDVAKHTRGALLFEGAGGSQHVVVSLGDGDKTIEARSAHTSPNIGSFSMSGRPFILAGLIPGLDYHSKGKTIPQPVKSYPYPGIVFKYVRNQKLMGGAAVAWIQGRLVAKGFGVGRTGVDGWYGSATDTAVRAFQAKMHLQVDGDVGLYTWTALAKS